MLSDLHGKSVATLIILVLIEHHKSVFKFTYVCWFFAFSCSTVNPCSKSFIVRINWSAMSTSCSSEYGNFLYLRGLKVSRLGSDGVKGVCMALTSSLKPWCLERCSRITRILSKRRSESSFKNDSIYLSSRAFWRWRSNAFQHSYILSTSEYFHEMFHEDS